MIKILFVCHGNICRSPMAEYIFKHLVRNRELSDAFVVSSAATSREEIGNDIYPPAKRVLRSHGVPFGRHFARQVSQSDYKEYDIIRVMDKFNLRDMLRIFGGDPEGKIALLNDDDVEDPWYTGDFDSVYASIEAGCSALLDSLLEKDR